MLQLDPPVCLPVSDVGVILPAAGTGSRMGCTEAKQYCTIKGRPLFTYALEGFLAMPSVSVVALVADDPKRMKDEVDWLKLSNADKIVYVQGGTSRHISIKLGLEALVDFPESQLQYVVVHDAVRPVVSPKWFASVLVACRAYGVASLCTELVSTVIQTDKQDMLIKTLVRNEYLASETPQVFKVSLLRKAYSLATELELETGTECIELVKKYTGVKAKIVRGPAEKLWKVTHKKDLYTAEGSITETGGVLIVCGAESPCAKPLTDHLSQKISFVRRTSLETEAREIVANNNITTIIYIHPISFFELRLDTFPSVCLGHHGLTLHVMLTQMSVAQLGWNHSNIIQSLRQPHDDPAMVNGSKVVVHYQIGTPIRHFVKLVLAVIIADHDVFNGQVLFV